MAQSLPAFPFGAVYYRKANPPRADWERDYRTAAEDGMNAFRHWFLWSAIETAHGVFDWEDYDRHFDLAERYGLKTILAEHLYTPEWAFHEYAHALILDRDGRKPFGKMNASCGAGGTAGLCLDHADARLLAEEFLKQMVLRYKDHPGMGGYDIWNECNYTHQSACYCDATADRFRTWLKNKYGDVRSVGQAWRRFSFSEWEHVTPPRQVGPYPDTLDWLQFRLENAYELMQWRVDLVRRFDPVNTITAHGVARTLRFMAQGGTHEWRAASKVQVYGYTWGSCRHGDEPWKQFHAVDLVRAGSRGKDFWHAESYAGPLWLESKLPRDEGRIATPEDIRYWQKVSFMAGARGSFYLRWRPLLNGPLFGAFGPYGMDGSRTDRSKMASKIAKWVTDPAHRTLWQSRPVPGDIGILVVPETQLFTYAQQENTAYYSSSMEGAYQGFFDANIQADWVLIDHIGEYDAIYLPYPVMLSSATAQRLAQWVQDGGTLIAEGCPGYWGDGAFVGTVQPNSGLDLVFGVREHYVEFTPDLLVDLKVTVNGTSAWGGLFMQAYTPTTAKPVGWYADGKIAACDHAYGKGRTRLVGTMCGAGYDHHTHDRSPEYFRDALAFAGKTQNVDCDDGRVKARLQDGLGGLSVWVANPTRQPVPVTLRLSPACGHIKKGRVYWGDDVAALVSGNTIALTAPARDVTVIQLER